MRRGDNEDKVRGGIQHTRKYQKKESGEGAKGTVSQNSHDPPCQKAVIQNNRIRYLITVVKT